MRVNLSIIITVLIFYHQAHSQATITFKVLDQSDNPLSNASIQLLKSKDGDVLYFGFTDKNGKKAFNGIKQDSLLVKISHLGYSKEERTIIIKEYEYLFRLSPSETVLKEVSISGYPESFKVKEDTISYNIKNATDGTERNLGDVLKKLPGLDVDEKGIVSHQGKKIDKILVDGNDFFGNKHQIATQNLKPEMIGNAELISNYSDNPLEGKGGKTILNLKMNDEYKNKYIGNTAFDYGLIKRYNNRNNLFRFVNRGNVSMISSLDNVGISPLTTEDYIEMRGGISSFIQSSGNQVTQLDFNQFPKFIFNNENFKQKKNGFGALNYTQNSGKLKINGYSYLNYSKQTESIVKNRTFLNESNLNFVESSTDNSSGLLSSTYMNLKYIPNEKNYWDLHLNVNPNKDNSTEFLTMTEGNSTNEYTTSQVSNNFNSGYQLSYQNKINEDWIVFSDVSQSYATNKKQLDIASDAPFLFWKNRPTVLQNYRLTDYTSNLTTKLQYKKNKDQYTLSLGYFNNNQILKTNIDNTDSAYFKLTNETFHISFGNTNFITSKLTFGTGNKLSIYQNDFRKFQSWFRYEPSANLSYHFSFSRKLTLSAGLSNQNAGIIQLADSPIILNYRTITRSGIENYDRLTNTLNLGLSYLHFDNEKELTLHSDITYSHRENNVIQTNDFSHEYITNIYVFSPFEDIYAAKIVLDKRVRMIPFSLKNFLYINHTNSLNYLTEHESILTNNTYVYRFNLFSHFKSKAFQFEAGLQFNKTSLRQSYNHTFSKIINYNSFIKFKGVIKEKVIWDLKLTNVSQESPLGKNELFFVSPTLTVDSKNKKWTYSLYGNNVFNMRNNRKYVSKLTNISIDNSTTAILSGYLLLGVKYSF